MNRNAQNAWDELKMFIFEWSLAYPEDVFLPIDQKDRDKLVTRDRVSAQMGRHMTKRILEKMERLEKMSDEH